MKFQIFIVVCLSVAWMLSVLAVGNICGYGLVFWFWALASHSAIWSLVKLGKAREAK